MHLITDTVRVFVSQREPVLTNIKEVVDYDFTFLILNSVMLLLVHEWYLQSYWAKSSM